MEHKTYTFLSLMMLVVSTRVLFCDVISDLTDPCLRKYFYRGEPPVYFSAPRSFRNIGESFLCQKWENEAYFISRYSIQYRIPIYSAFKIDSFLNEADTTYNYWRLEPQISPGNQARNVDYKGSGFHRGHLNPKSYNRYSNKGIKATFTLTNAAPLIGEINTKWYRNSEDIIWQKMKNDCNFTNAARYIITGVVPSANSLQYGANIPAYIWTAACCDAMNAVPRRTHGWSFGILMNTYDGTTAHFSIIGLESQLELLMPNYARPTLFKYTLINDIHHSFFGCNFNY